MQKEKKKTIGRYIIDLTPLLDVITGLPDAAFQNALAASFAKKPKLIPMNLEVLAFAQKWVKENVK